MISQEWIKVEQIWKMIRTWASMLGPCWDGAHMVSLAWVDQGPMRNRFDTWAPFRTNHILHNGTVSQLAWVTPCLDRIRCELWWSVIGGSGALVLPDRSLIVGCVCVKCWGMNQHLSLAVSMVVGLVLVWEKLYTPAGFLIYCNSRTLGHWAYSCTLTLT